MSDERKGKNSGIKKKAYVKLIRAGLSLTFSEFDTTSEISPCYFWTENHVLSVCCDKKTIFSTKIKLTDVINLLIFLQNIC